MQRLCSNCTAPRRCAERLFVSRSPGPQAAKLVAHADLRTPTGTRWSHTATSGGPAPCSGMLPGFLDAGTLGRVISLVLRTQVGTRQVTYQGLLPRGPHRQRSEPRGCAPPGDSGPRSSPVAKPLPGLPTPAGRRGSLRPSPGPSSPPCPESYFELLAVCRRRCAVLHAQGNKATKNSSQLTSTYFQKRK